MAGSGARYNLRVSRRRPIGRNRRMSFIETMAVIVVIGAVIAMAVWFFFFSSGGIGPGTV